LHFLPVPDHRQVSFYLATEEHLARQYPGQEFFFLWQVEPSAIMGRHQVMEQEVNIDYCRQHGISLFRRKSGGGCVYADRSNVMLSMVMDGDRVGLAYQRFTQLVLLALRRMGLNAAATGRNDILVAPQGTDAASEGRKVCGTAFYQLPTPPRSIVHSTLLYDTCMENMVGSITPPDQKLVARGIRSVRQRIALLKDFTPLSLDEVKKALRFTLCTEPDACLTEDDLATIERLERSDYPPVAQQAGQEARAEATVGTRIEGVGTVDVVLTLRHGRIASLALQGDFFSLEPLQPILQPLIGLPPERPTLSKALPKDLHERIRGLTPAILADLIVEAARHANGSLPH
jgi:lipoic acid synthetase/lipoate-protein ligase A